MQGLRNIRVLARLVLVWFALSIGVAVASPMIKPQAMELICSGSGAMKLLVKGDGGSGQSVALGHTLDCPLCASLGAPPPPAREPAAPAQMASHMPRPLHAARVAPLTAAPPPARGPPAAA